jgi:hypothetical protein
MKSNIIWNITLCNLLKVYQRFGGTYRLHLQGLRITEQETFNALQSVLSLLCHHCCGVVYYPRLLTLLLRRIAFSE